MSFINKELCAVELFSAGWCNLNCRYCYIPKDEELTKTVHQRIIKSIENGDLLNRLSEAFGENLQHISHWGTEPTLTLPIFTKTKWYEKALKRFPNLKQVKMSSNFMTNPNNLIEFVATFPSDKVDMDIQLSLDGTKEMTDRNRGNAATEKIMEHGAAFFTAMNNLDIKNKISVHFKPTISMQDIVDLGSIDKLREYYQFFDDYIGKLLLLNTKKRIMLSVAVDPTLVLPGFYTKESGDHFSKLVENQFILSKEKFKYVTPYPAYYNILKSKIIGNAEKYFTRHWTFQCSAGSTQVAMQWNEMVHLCHRSFYLGEEDWEGFKKALTNFTSESINSEDYESGRYDLFRKYYTADYSDTLKVARTQYLARAYHDFWAQKLASNVATIYEMSLSGQMSKCYQNKELAELLAKFLVVVECPLENILNNGSIFLHSLGNFRVFGNGAFEQIIERVINEQTNV